MANRFSYPADDDIQRWSALLGNERSVEDSRRISARVRRHGRLFTYSVLLPVAVGLPSAALLGQHAASLPGATYWTLFVATVLVMVVGIVGWRPLLGHWAPRVALDYYASACVDHLQRDLPDVRVYLRKVLPALESVLLSPRHAETYAASRGSRRVLARSLAEAADRLAAAEQKWLRAEDEATRQALVEALGTLVAARGFEDWPAPADAVSPDGGQTPAATGSIKAVFTKVRDQMTEKAVTQLIVAIGALLALGPKLASVF